VEKRKGVKKESREDNDTNGQGHFGTREWVQKIPEFRNQAAIQ